LHKTSFRRTKEIKAGGTVDSITPASMNMPASKNRYGTCTGREHAQRWSGWSLVGTATASEIPRPDWLALPRDLPTNGTIPTASQSPLPKNQKIEA
jgi:hypothetical protein